MVAVRVGRDVHSDQRVAAREEVFFRTRAFVAGSGAHPVQIVNISATGFMARTEAVLDVGTAVTVRLPVVGERKAEVRWALGGRIGCHFDRSIDFADYLQLLAALASSAD